MGEEEEDVVAKILCCSYADRSEMVEFAATDSPKLTALYLGHFLLTIPSKWHTVINRAIVREHELVAAY